MKYIYNKNEKDIEKNIGKKAKNLFQLKEIGIEIPNFLVVSNEYFEKKIFIELQNKLNKKLENWNNIFEIIDRNEKILEKISEFIEKYNFEKEFLEELDKNIENEKYYAIRSSSIEEDGHNFSYAGQFETFLYVQKKEIANKIKKIWISSFSEHIMEYRKKGNLYRKINVPAVIIQEMINSEKSGVAFSVNPISYNEEEIVISVVLGLGTSIVDGDENGDLYIVNKKTQFLKKEIKEKGLKQSFDFENKKIKKEKISIQNEILNKMELEKLINEIKKIEEYYKFPQDIEWAYENNNLYILQSRPITTLKESNENEINSIIWDNSNIIESYPEITLPLTFSFIKIAYSNVYKRFSEITGVSKKIVENYQDVYDNMLGILNGRVYYNLINWYKLIILFPNSKNNSKYMEQMMGVKKELSKEIIEENLTYITKNMNFFEKLINKIQKIKCGIKIFLNMFTIEKKAEKFYEIISENLNKNEAELSKMNAVELKKYYKYLENKFLKNWEIPIINDFLVMIWFGVSKKLIQKYFPNNFEEINNILIAQEGKNMVSVEPSKYIEKMSILLKENKNLQDEIEQIIFKNKNINNIQKITENNIFNNLFNEYLSKFGDRTIHELKLESETLKENPLILIKSIYSLSKIKRENIKNEINILEEQNKIYKNLKINMINKIILKKCVFYAKKFVKLRENLRYERTKVFGMVRKIMKKMGVLLHKSGIIENERDIFYLKIDEIFSLIDGTLIDTNLKEIIKMRKNNYKKYDEIATLPDRFLTKGFLEKNFYVEDLIIDEKIGDRKILQGIGCNSGIVKGKVKVVLNPLKTEINEGDIVVTKSTDPSWVMFFPLLKGLIVEKGSLLSHSAIISREMNIPAIVGVYQVTQKLKTGDLVQFDGKTGIIKVIEKGDF